MGQIHGRKIYPSWQNVRSSVIIYNINWYLWDVIHGWPCGEILPLVLCVQYIHVLLVQLTIKTFNFQGLEEPRHAVSLYGKIEFLNDQKLS